MRHQGAIALVTAAGLGLGGCGGAALQTASPPADFTPTQSTVIYDCAGQGQVRPRALILYCADANLTISHVVWQGWGTSTTRGVGVVAANTCTPNCAAGHLRYEQASLIATGLSLTGTRASYTELTLSGAKILGTAANQAFSLTINGPVYK